MRGNCIHIQGMHGLGDNIMQRPFIRAAAKRFNVYLETPWPELYADIERVFPVRANSQLRTQAKSEALSQMTWHRPIGRRHRLNYGPQDLARSNIWRALDRKMSLGDVPFVLDLPTLPRVDIDTGGKPLAVVRPVTARAEWLNEARNPLPGYVNAIAEELALTHYVVCIADLKDGEEWLEGPLPFCDLALVRGELTSLEALSLVASADVVIGGVGWILPAALAARRAAFIVLGGMGAHNGPERLTDAEWVPSGRVGFAMPDTYCLCDQKSHQCNKRITDIGRQFRAWCAENMVPLCDNPTSNPLSFTHQMG